MSEGVAKCPCLYSAGVPLCRADTEALRIPPAEHLGRFCLGGKHRRCTLFRGFLGALTTRPEQWRATSPGYVPEAPRTRRRGVRGGSA